MPDTFGGTWNRPDQSGRGRSQHEIQERVSYDHEPQTGCGAMFLLCVLTVAAVIGAVLA